VSKDELWRFVVGERSVGSKIYHVVYSQRSDKFGKCCGASTPNNSRSSAPIGEDVIRLLDYVS
jgi:hypothetical protein